MKKIWMLSLLIGFVTQSNLLFAVKPAHTISVEETVVKKETLSNKVLEKQEKLTKKLQKLTRKIESKWSKQMEKMEMQQKKGLLDEPKVRLGLLCILISIAVWLLVGLGIFGGTIGWIGSIVGVVGIVLLILGLLGF